VSQVQPHDLGLALKQCEVDECVAFAYRHLVQDREEPGGVFEAGFCNAEVDAQQTASMVHITTVTKLIRMRFSSLTTGAAHFSDLPDALLIASFPAFILSRVCSFPVPTSFPKRG
jgi:hypothetical protein